MNFEQAVSSCFSKYVTFAGRASKSEYWHWCLFCLIIGTCSLIIDISVLKDLENQPIYSIFSLVTFLPSFAVSVRRLHDVNRSGWWLLVSITGFGILLILYWAVQPSIEEENEY
tara:strand:- start:1033 stop:1374 length:342 start_codon:yes stop_codon:yes gene_type:complete